MALVSEDVPSGEGQFASMQFGDATRMQQLQKEVQSRTGTSTPTPQPQPGATPPPGPGPQPQQSGGEIAQPSPPAVPAGRLDLNQVFPPMPQLQPQQPWRQWLRSQADIWKDHPTAGSAWQRLAEMIKDQHGPLR